MTANNDGATFEDADPVRYTIADNAFLEAKDISAKATWLLIYLKSRPPGWVTRMSHLATVKTDGITAIRSAIQELIEAGYLFRSQERNADQQYANAVYLFSWYPKWKQPVEPFPTSQEPVSENLISANGTSENLTLVSTEVVSTEVVSTDVVTTTSRSEPPSAIPSAAEKGESPPNLDGFEDFWQAYPKRNGLRVGKREAAEKWAKISDEDRVQVIDNLARYVAFVDAGLLPKDAHRWLTKDRWREYGPDSKPEPVRDIHTTTVPFQQTRAGQKRKSLPYGLWSDIEESAEHLGGNYRKAIEQELKTLNRGQAVPLTVEDVCILAHVSVEILEPCR